MKLERDQDVLKLYLTPESFICFREEWVQKLRALPYEQFGEFIRSTIYPALSSQERILWNKSTINNIDLQSAIRAYTDPVDNK